MIDGAKALRKALRAVFGERVGVARCWLHKERNLREYLPERVYGTLHWRMKKLIALNSLADARKELAALREWVAGLSSRTAASLEEVGEELLTLHALGITGELRKSLSSTKPHRIAVLGRARQDSSGEELESAALAANLALGGVLDHGPAQKDAPGARNGASGGVAHGVRTQRGCRWRAA